MITMIWYVRQYIWWLWIQDIWLLQMAEVQAKLDEVEKAGAAGRNEVSSIFFKFQGALDIAPTWWWTDSSHTFLQVKFCPLIKSFVWWHDATQDQSMAQLYFDSKLFSTQEIFKNSSGPSGFQKDLMQGFHGTFMAFSGPWGFLKDIQGTFRVS